MKHYIVLLGLILVMASCAGMKPPRPAGFESYDAAVVDVRADAEIEEAHVQKLQEMVVAALEEQQVFRAIRPGTDESAAEGVIIQINITRLRTETDLHRITWGSMARSNEIAADIAVVDGTNRQVLSSFSLQAESPDYPPSFDWPWGTLDKAMHLLTRRLVNILLDWSQATNIDD
jgi:hypothetical protein